MKKIGYLHPINPVVDAVFSFTRAYISHQTVPCSAGGPRTTGFGRDMVWFCRHSFFGWAGDQRSVG